MKQIGMGGSPSGPSSWSSGNPEKEELKIVGIREVGGHQENMTH